MTQELIEALKAGEAALRNQARISPNCQQADLLASHAAQLQREAEGPTRAHDDQARRFVLPPEGMRKLHEMGKQGDA